MNTDQFECKSPFLFSMNLSSSNAHRSSLFKESNMKRIDLAFAHSTWQSLGATKDRAGQNKAETEFWSHGF